MSKAPSAKSKLPKLPAIKNPNMEREQKISDRKKNSIGKKRSK